MSRQHLIAACLLSAAYLCAPSAHAQDLQTPPVAPPPPAVGQTPDDPNQIQFSADTLEYDTDTDVVTAHGDVRLYRRSDRLRADNVVWNRKTGKVTANGNIAVTNAAGDVAYGDSIVLTDSLKDGVVDNMLLVLDEGGRLAARQGTRSDSGVVTLNKAAYTPCNVVDSAGCPKRPSWEITAVRVTYDPGQERVYYKSARLRIFDAISVPLPALSIPVNDSQSTGLLSPRFQISRVNGLDIATPFFVDLAPNRQLTITPHVFSNALPMLQSNFRALTDKGAFSITGYGTYSRRNDDFGNVGGNGGTRDFRGYLDGIANYQFDEHWSASGVLRVATDKTFLRRYDISRDDRLRNNASIERIGRDSYFAINAWAVQTLRLTDTQGVQPIALPEIDYRRRFTQTPLGGVLKVQLNSLALDRTEGQDTQRAFASAQWDLRRITPWGQLVTLTAYGRGDVYHTDNTLATSVPSYRGMEGWEDRLIGAVALDVQWPLVGAFLGGTQRITPRAQIVAAPPLANLDVPNEDARAVDLEDSNLFALNRFPGYDRFEDSTRFTYGVDWVATLPGFTIDSQIGQSYRLSSRPTLFPDGTGLTERFSDFVGRTEIRYRDFVSVTARYRFDKDNLQIRRGEIDATVGSRQTYFQVGYLLLNRNISTTLEDLSDHEEIRTAARIKIAKFWSAFGSAVVDLTNRSEDPLSVADGFTPVRHRIGVLYEDSCLKLGLTWKRDYQNTGDARAGNSYLLSLAFKNLGR